MFELYDRQVSADGKYVLRTGKIFEAGDYPDKKFKITSQELNKAAKEFEPVPIDVEHKSTVFDGKMGQLQFVEVNEKGELFGGALIPRAIDEVLGGKYKVSATWSPDKKIKGLAIVKNPRITDAALFAAHTFSVEEKDLNVLFAEAAKTWEGRIAIQQIHDISASHGAVCDEENKQDSPNYYYSEQDESLVQLIEFVSKEESKWLQKIHDAAVKAGAKCRFVEERKFSKSASGTQMENTMTIKEMKDSILGLLKNVPDVETGNDAQEENKELKSNFSDEDKKALEDKIKELESKITEFSAVLEEQKTEQIKTLEADKKENKAEVAEFVKSIVGKKVLPAQGGTLEALFSKLVEDDMADSFEFSVGDEKLSRFDLIKKIFSEMTDINTDDKEEKIFSVNVLGSTDNLSSELVELQQRTKAAAKKRNASFSK